MNNLTEALVTILTAIVGVAILSVLVSKKSNTKGVIEAFGAAFGNSLGIATAPVTGANVTGLSGLNYGGSNGGASGISFNLPPITGLNLN